MPSTSPPDTTCGAARRRAGGGATLLRGLDADKDQSYFLHALDQGQLAPALFPVGTLAKPRVRELAREAGFAVAAKKDSTGICFIGERKFGSFLADYLPARPGDTVTESGEVVGRHSGLMFHTLGQRQGLGIGGRTGADATPWYVLDKDLERNRLVVGQGHDHPRLLHRRLVARQASWIAGAPPARTASPLRCSAQVRYRQRDVPCTVAVHREDVLDVTFDEPVRAATPGQSLVLYDGERCLGGAVIDTLHDSVADRSVRYGASAAELGQRAGHGLLYSSG